MDAMSIDALKKTPGFTNLPNYFLKTYGTSPERLYAAKRNFSASLAAYSLFCYILQIKDRHNGNVLIDIEGHVIHIDFGFMLSIAPGGAFSIETAPFKLTEEMVEVLGGLESELFNEFVKAFTAGFLALRANAENLISNLTALAVNSPFPCFHGKDAQVLTD
jgi:phosphatidylinositol 4-kinase